MDSHEIIVTNEVSDNPTRDQIRISVACSTPSCFVGKVTANIVLTFRDEQGREWLAAAAMGPLKQYDDDALVPVEEMKDRAFTLHRFTVVDRSEGGDG
jgi:hypothetical protein